MLIEGRSGKFEIHRCDLAGHVHKAGQSNKVDEKFHTEIVKANIEAGVTGELTKNCTHISVYAGAGRRFEMVPGGGQRPLLWGAEHPDTTLIFYRFWFRENPDLRTRILQDIIFASNTGYNTKGCLVANNERIIFKDTGSRFCCELPDRIFKAYGYDLLPGVREDKCKPGQLLESEELEFVGAATVAEIQQSWEKLYSGTIGD